MVLKLNKVALACLTAIMTSLPVGSAALAADSNYSQGVQAYGKGDYAHASRYFEEALKSRTNDPLLWYYAALSLHQMKNWPLARQRYKTLALSFPNTDAGKRAVEALRLLEPSFLKILPAPRASAGPAAAAGKSAAQGNLGAADTETDDSAEAASEKALKQLALTRELATLPDTAYFYFKKNSQGHMEVDLQLNGHPVKAIFDTGATAFFYKDQLQAAGIDLNRAKAGEGAAGWAGVRVETSTIPAEIKLGTLTRKIDIVIQESAGGLGSNLIGQDFVKGYQYEIDDKGNRVDLKKTLQLAEKKYDPLYDIPLQKIGKDDVVPIQVNGRQCQAFIDTGAARTIMDPATAKAVGAEESGEHLTMSGVGGNFTVAVAYVTIRIGPMLKENFPVLIGGRAGTGLGADLMDGWRYKVDREHKLVRFFH